MNKERFQAALNYIGDDLIAEAADCKPKASIRAKPRPFIKYFAGAAAAVLAGVIGLKLWSGINFGNTVSLENTSSPNDAFSSIIDEINKTKSDGDIVMDEISKIIKDGESSPGIRFSSVYGKGDPTLDEWRKFDNVIWYSSDIAMKADKELGAEGLKSDDAFNNDVKPGSVKTSALLYKLITTDFDNSPMFAVRVWFDSCIDEEEMNAWKYKGMTIREIAEMTYNPYDENTANELFDLLDDAYYDYYLVEMQRFYENTFKPRNLEIYPIEQGSTIKGYNWFYCFMSAEMVAGLTCGSDEAFFLDLALKN